MSRTLSLVDSVLIGLLLVIFGGIVLHAPLTVGVSTLWPDASLLIKSWKEVLLGVALLLCVVSLTTHRRWDIVNSKVVQLIAVFAALNLILVPLYFTGFESTVAGLFINLRFFLYFVLVYAALQVHPQLRSLFVKVFFAGAALVVGFAVLQVTVLPADILKHIGYNESTIVPYLTVDENPAYVRINSTLRGPNPLGVYGTIVAAIVLAVFLRPHRALKRWESVGLGALGVGSLVAVWFSYSRSAALAFLLAIAVVALVAKDRHITKGVWLGLAACALIIGGTLFVFRDTQFVSQVIMHEDPEEGNDINSNEGHAESLIDGTQRMLRQPLGAGIGSTGSASLLHDGESLIIENQYLFIAHENGWVGLVLFLTISYHVLRGLWQRRAAWLALGVFASGLGLALAGMFLPVWVDDTVSIIWWGLAAVVLAVPASDYAAKRKGAKK